MARGERHWVPAKKPAKDYPFGYELQKIKRLPDGVEPVKIDYKEGTNLIQEVRNALIRVFPFNKLLDEYVYDEKKLFNHKEYIAVDVYGMKDVPMKTVDYLVEKPNMTVEEAKSREDYSYEEIDDLTEQWKIYNETPTEPRKKDGSKPVYKTKKALVVVSTQYLLAHSFRSGYRFTLLRTMEQLEEHLPKAKVLSFDTEATGLNPVLDYITGVNFAYEPKKGYYVPINHNKALFGQYNLGDEALDLVYQRMTEVDVVYMFNSRFDMRMMEFHDIEKEHEAMEYYTSKKLLETHKTKYDMSKVNVIDTQLNCYFADVAYSDHSLKGLEKHFLGYYRIDLGDTLKTSGLNDFNTANISPENILFYAAQDGISTLELGLETDKYYKEFGLSGKLDQMITYKLMKMENPAMRIDEKYLQEQLDIIVPRLNEITKSIQKEIGDVNLNSSVQKQALFKSFNLDTGVKTKSGGMSTSTDAVNALIERLNKEGKKYPKWLELLGEHAKLEKLNNSFFSPLLNQASLTGGRARFNYRHGNTSTGRFSSGEDRNER